MKFTKSDLAKITHNTNINNHGGNYIFIARKIGSKLVKDFQKIEKDNVEGLDGEAAEKQYRLYKELMLELKEKYPDDCQKVYNRL